MPVLEIEHGSAGVAIVNVLRDGADEIRRVLEVLLTVVDPLPVTYMVTEQTMNQLYPPQSVANDHAPGGGGDGGMHPDDHWEAVVAVGVCVQVTESIRSCLPPPASGLQPPLGARVVALCPARIDRLQLRINDPAVTERQLALVVWLHELVHWSHGAVVNDVGTRGPEEAMTQMATVRLLYLHRDGWNLRHAMRALAELQPAVYRTYQLGDRLECIQRLNAAGEYVSQLLEGTNLDPGAQPTTLQLEILRNHLMATSLFLNFC